MTIFTDSDLRDYLDGEMSDAREAALIAALANDPDLETRLMALDDVAPLVRDAFCDICDDKTLTKVLPLLTAAPKKAPVWRPMLIAASFGAVMAVLGTTTLMSREPATPDWMQQVAAYQSLYSVETIAAVSASESELFDQLVIAEAALDLSLPKEALAQIDGLELRRTQMLAYQNQPLVQIVFSDTEGRPIALCILMTDKAPDGDQIEMAQLHGLESAAFANAGFGFLLIGPTDASVINNYADQIKDVLARG